MAAARQGSIRDRVLDAAREKTRIPLLPEFAQRALEMSRLPPDEVDISRLAELLSRDSAIVSRVLRVANSPRYGLNTRISTVRQAIVTIGLDDFMSLILAACVLGSLRKVALSRNLDPAQFWVHSLAVAGAARSMAAADPAAMQSPAEISLSALVHDIGKSLFCSSFAAEYDRCLERARDSRRLLESVEEEEMGLSHAVLGGIMAEEWKLPSVIAQSVRYHHTPREADEAWRDSAWLIACADNFMLSEKIGQSGNRPRSLAEMDAARPPDNGKPARPSALSAEDKDKILRDVGRELKGAMIQWESGSADEDVSEEKRSANAPSHDDKPGPPPGRSSRAEATDSRGSWKAFVNALRRILSRAFGRREE